MSTRMTFVGAVFVAVLVLPGANTADAKPMCPVGYSLRKVDAGRYMFCCRNGVGHRKAGSRWMCNDNRPAAAVNCPAGHFLRGFGRNARCVRVGSVCPIGWKGQRSGYGALFCCPRTARFVRHPGGDMVCYQPGRRGARAYSCPPGAGYPSRTPDGRYHCCPPGTRAVGRGASVSCRPIARCPYAHAKYLSRDQTRHACCAPGSKPIYRGRSGVSCSRAPRCARGGTLYNAATRRPLCCGPNSRLVGRTCVRPPAFKRCPAGQLAHYAPNGRGFCCPANKRAFAPRGSLVICY